MHGLAFVVVFGMQLPVGAGDGLRRLIGLEPQVARLDAPWPSSRRPARCSTASGCSEPAGLRDQSPAPIAGLHRLGIFALQEQNASQIVQRNPVSRILCQHASQPRCGAFVIAVRAQHLARRRNWRAPGSGLSASAFSSTVRARSMSPSCTAQRPMLTQPSGLFGSASVTF